MTESQIIAAAEAAIRAMSPEAQAEFVKLFEAGQRDQTQTIAQCYAVEGVGRQMRLASAALENGRIMDGLCDLVFDRVAA